jgi:hypothetical protein
VGLLSGVGNAVGGAVGGATDFLGETAGDLATGAKESLPDDTTQDLQESFDEGGPLEKAGAAVATTGAVALENTGASDFIRGGIESSDALDEEKVEESIQEGGFLEKVGTGLSASVTAGTEPISEKGIKVPQTVASLAAGREVSEEETGEVVKEGIDVFEGGIGKAEKAVDESIEGTALDNPVTDAVGGAYQFAGDAFVAEPFSAAVKGTTGVDVDTGETDSKLSKWEAFDLAAFGATSAAPKAAKALAPKAGRAASKAGKATKTGGPMALGGLLKGGAKISDELFGAVRRGSDDVGGVGDDIADATDDVNIGGTGTSTNDFADVNVGNVGGGGSGSTIGDVSSTFDDVDFAATPPGGSTVDDFGNALDDINANVGEGGGSGGFTDLNIGESIASGARTAGSGARSLGESAFSGLGRVGRAAGSGGRRIGSAFDDVLRGSDETVDSIRLTGEDAARIPNDELRRLGRDDLADVPNDVLRTRFGSDEIAEVSIRGSDETVEAGTRAAGETTETAARAADDTGGLGWRKTALIGTGAGTATALGLGAIGETLGFFGEGDDGGDPPSPEDRGPNTTGEGAGEDGWSEAQEVPQSPVRGWRIYGQRKKSNPQRTRFFATRDSGSTYLQPQGETGSSAHYFGDLRSVGRAIQAWARKQQNQQDQQNGDQSDRGGGARGDGGAGGDDSGGGGSGSGGWGEPKRIQTARGWYFYQQNHPDGRKRFFGVGKRQDQGKIYLQPEGEVSTEIHHFESADALVSAFEAWVQRQESGETGPGEEPGGGQPDNPTKDRGGWSEMQHVQKLPLGWHLYGQTHPEKGARYVIGGESQGERIYLDKEGTVVNSPVYFTDQQAIGDALETYARRVERGEAETQPGGAKPDASAVTDDAASKDADSGASGVSSFLSSLSTTEKAVGALAIGGAGYYAYQEGYFDDVLDGDVADPTGGGS